MVRVNVNHHRGEWKLENSHLVNQVNSLFNGLSNLPFREINTYLMDGSKMKFETNSREFTVFVNASPGTFEKENAVIDINGATYAVEQLIANNLGDYAKPVFDSKGQLIFYHAQVYNEIYIPYNLIPLQDSVETTKFITYAVKLYIDDIISEFVNKNSWMKTKNKDELRSNVENHVKRDTEAELASARDRLERHEMEIRNYTEVIANAYKARERYSQQIIALETNSSDDKAIKSLIEGLDMIAQHEQVSNILVDRDVITIFIDKVYAYSRIRSKTKRFYIGNMHVKINMANTQVKFFGDNPKRGFWTEQDPHPHVNGSNGVACLGNASATIAELCSQKEIYALFLIVKDFMENANAEDAAGRKIVNWDEVDEEGKVIVNEKANCGNCGDRYLASELTEVGTQFEDGTITGRQDWCPHCSDEYAYYSDDVEMRVADDLSNEIDDYFGEDED